MIKKILSIKNVGLFGGYSAAGKTDFGKLTLCYADNGRGKTTLTAILRSLRLNEPKLIAERSTIGGSDKPEVLFLFDTGQIAFKDGKWGKTQPDIEIFDAAFVSENVSTGTAVEYEHKKSLYRFVVGEQGVQLAQKVEDLGAEITQQNALISAKSSEIVGLGVDQKNVESHASLPRVPDVETAIAEKSQEVAGLEQAKEIADKAQLAQISVPAFAADQLRALLARELDGLSSSAIDRVKNHIAKKMTDGSETWIRDGIAHQKENECPFCGQSTEGLELVDVYRKYFGEAYANLKQDIVQFRQNFAASFDLQNLLVLQRRVTDNTLLLQFWSKHIDRTVPSLDLGLIETRWRELGKIIQEHLKKKANAPLEPLATTDELNTAVIAYDGIVTLAREYNDAVASFNDGIDKKKKAVAAGNLDVAKNSLVALKAAQLRYTPLVDKAYDEYKVLVQKRQQLVKDKEVAKQKLDKYAQAIFVTYEKAINDYLDKFGAGFRICKTQGSYVGGKPNSSWQIEINNVSLEPGDGKKDAGSPCLRNTLSGGDKSALAFAFFMARLDQDPNLSQKIIIFDDPITSLDSNRKYRTAQIIVGLSKRAKQIAVLSHDLHFMGVLWDLADRAATATLEVVRRANNSSIAPWDVDVAMQSEHTANYSALMEYLQQGPRDDAHRRTVARCIRPLVETSLRIRFPVELKGAHMVGEIVNRIESANATDPLSKLKNLTDEVNAINEFSRRYHHGENSKADSEPISDGELKSYVQSALGIVRGV